MKIGLLRIGQVDLAAVSRIQESLDTIFPNTESILINETLPVPKEAFDRKRKQYRSEIILGRVEEYAEKQKTLQRILGITDVDIFTSSLNFVFGEARCPGKVALISLHRLRPEFDGGKPNVELLMDRTEKEAVHELGHTFGLAHCSNPFCVMYFSNSIFDTDRKQSLFCSKCQTRIESITDTVGEKPWTTRSKRE
jgi:archaemetzincin